MTSGAGTNLKEGSPVSEQRQKKIFFVVPLHYLALKYN